MMRPPALDVTILPVSRFEAFHRKGAKQRKEDQL